ncbi:MAG: FAD-dependent oxidoreductase [Gammaproteobacteria bacterium]|nr:FAD-dependent oxidoreductase [Gammaproteobacteria bacterium]
MKSQARVVVIGGGVVGVSTLYHLVKKGWPDVVLCERSELTAGSTWHAAGLLPLFNMSYTVGQLHKYSVDLYKTLEAETGQDVGFHVTGNMRLACTQDRMDEYRKYCGTANTIGVPFEMITPSEVKALWPLCATDGLLGALYHPDDGHIAPVDLTNALAKGARAGGAEIYQQTEVTRIERTAGGEWQLKTTKGDISCEHIVAATGNYGRTTGRMVGINVPAIAVQHQYIVTDVVPELKAYREEGGKELAVLRESDASYYLREERMGFILGPYEVGAPAVFADGVPESFEKDLFPGDLERLMPHVEAAMKRVPAFASAGIKDIINGPICYTPDGSPLVGPAWDVPNFWLNEGHSFGVTAAGGAGWQLAEWIVEGEPGIDMLGTDPRRFGAYTTKAYTVAKNEEAYENVFTVHYPDEERPAARPAKTSPLHDKLERMGAVWGQRYGWERPNWFAPDGVARADKWSFRRSNYFAAVGDECRAIRDTAGLIDLTGFTKHEVSGPGAEDFLNHLVANTVPSRVGRTALCHALTRRSGGVRTEFTITKLDENHYYLVSSGAAERYDSDYLKKMAPADGSVLINNITTSRGCLVLAGPNSRELLASLTDAPLDNASFPWLTAQSIEVGLVPDVRAMRVNFVGELGWELHHPIEYAHCLFDAIVNVGEKFELKMVGMRAMESLRIEKSYRMWGTDLTPEYSAFEAGLDRFVKLGKDFIGKEALVAQRESGVPQRFVTLEVDGVRDCDARGNEPLFLGSREHMVGRATAGAYGYRIEKSLALAYIQAEHAAVGTSLLIDILGELKPAVIIEESPYDAGNARLRAAN